MEQEDKFLELMMNGDFNDFAIKKFNEKICKISFFIFTYYYCTYSNNKYIC